VAALEEPKVESDAEPDSPVKLHGPIAALYLAPLPPRRPSGLELLVASQANIPLPPVRPADLIAAAPETTASIAPLPPVRPANLVVAPVAKPGAGAKASPAADAGDADQLPKVITQGVSGPASGALALTETPPAPKYDNDTLLARAAELTAPLPPMPIPDVGAPSPVKAVAPESRHGGLVEDVARLFGSLPFDAFKAPAATDASDLRGAQQ